MTHPTVAPAPHLFFGRLTFSAAQGLLRRSGTRIAAAHPPESGRDRARGRA